MSSHSNSVLSDLASRLACSLDAEGRDQPESAAKLIQSLWVEDASSCEVTLRSFLKMRPLRHEFIDQICLASKQVDDPQFDTMLWRIRKTPGASLEAKTLLTMFLVSKGHTEAASDFDNLFRSICNRFLKGRIDESQLLIGVQQACLLRRRCLHTVLGEMLSKLQSMENERPYIHITQLEIVEVLYQGLRDGSLQLRVILSRPDSSTSQQEAAVYGLGCEREPGWFDLFVALYNQRSRGEEFPIRRECVNAIIYSCNPTNITDFLIASLEKERVIDRANSSRWFGRNSRRADVMRLLLGAAYCSKMDSRLEQELYEWLTSKELIFAAFAVVALERHGVNVEDLDKDLLKEVKNEKSFREHHFSYCDLLQLRGIHGDNY